MFASHFGMDGSPFQLSPDPKFYFDSHGHHRARAALRRGLSQASGFTVISGEIGAGKTTVVQAVLDELKPAFFAVAQIVSTQLDAEELLRSISIGFGLPSVGGDTASLAANLRRFLADLRTQRRRAILVVDEAQNLRPDAFDHLVAFAMRGSPSGRGMQICLVGQPELQVMVESRDLLAVREQICVSCHLGPIERAETGPYIAHRLHTVGWEGRPGFAAGSFDEIYRWTDGIPRRINSLCGRLMMACFMANQMTIGPAMVADIAREQLAEIGDLATEPQLLDLGFSEEVSTPAKPGPALFIVATRSDHVRAAAIMAAMAERVGWSSVKLVRVLDNDALALTGGLFDGLDWATGLISLGRPGNADGSEAADLHERFKLAVRRTSPSAVVAFGASDAVIACCAIARRSAATDRACRSSALRRRRLSIGTRRQKADRPVRGRLVPSRRGGRASPVGRRNFCCNGPLRWRPSGRLAPTGIARFALPHSWWRPPSRCRSRRAGGRHLYACPPRRPGAGSRSSAVGRSDCVLATHQSFRSVGADPAIGGRALLQQPRVPSGDSW